MAGIVRRELCTILSVASFQSGVRFLNLNSAVINGNYFQSESFIPGILVINRYNIR